MCVRARCAQPLSSASSSTNFKTPTPYRVGRAAGWPLPPTGPSAPTARPHPPGRLFFVGDRRSNRFTGSFCYIELFLSNAFRSEPPAPTSGRTAGLFGKLIQAAPGEQPAYLPLQVVRRRGPARRHPSYKAHVAADGTLLRRSDLRLLRSTTWPPSSSVSGRGRRTKRCLPRRHHGAASVCTALGARTLRARRHRGFSRRVYQHPEVRDLLLAATALSPSTNFVLVTPHFACLMYLDAPTPPPVPNTTRGAVAITITSPTCRLGIRWRTVLAELSDLARNAMDCCRVNCSRAAAAVDGQLWDLSAHVYV